MAVNFTQYFKEEKDIYVQNVARGQVSLQFGKGDQTVSFTLVRKRDPIVLTNHVPFRMIAESIDFRKILNRQPAVIKLLTDKEYEDYYKAKAKVNKTTVDAAIAQAETERLRAKNKPVETKAPDKEDAKEEADEDSAPKVEEVINGRVQHLCHQASASIPEADRMKPADLLAKLKDIAEEFTVDDYEYILANTNNKTIHSWARQAQKAVATAQAETTAE
jgi:hypothetical protein